MKRICTWCVLRYATYDPHFCGICMIKFKIEVYRGLAALDRYRGEGA